MIELLPIVFVAIAAWIYSWTFTAHGRIEFLPALICRVAALASRYGSPVTYSDSDRASANASTVRLMNLPATPGVVVEDDQLELPDRTLKLRWYWPEKVENCPVVLNIHGGAWWMGNDFIDDAVMRHLCHESGSIVLSVDYRLAPEHVYPAALEDCYQALLYLVEQASARGGDAARLVLHGTSAGGGLAAGLCLLGLQRGGPVISMQALVVPVTDLSGQRSGKSMQDFASGYVLTAGDLSDMIANYLPDEAARLQPLASPAYAENLHELPPAFVATAQFDPLRDQGEDFAKSLMAAGVQVVSNCYPETIHGFFGSKNALRQCITDTAQTIRVMV